MIKNASIKVAIKIKPSNNTVISSNELKKQVNISLSSQQTQTVQVDMIHDANITNQSIYKSCQLQQLIKKFLQGYNAAVITYGQTGSGKTFAFQGDSNNKGIIEQAIKQIFGQNDSNRMFKCSFLQIYNQKITDMLFPDNGGQKGLKLRWEIDKQFIVQQLTQKQCKNPQQMTNIWATGCKNRVINSNRINDQSSRSHSIFTISMQDKDKQGNYRSRYIHFVDLAGSQRVFSPVGRLSKQAIQINKSLFFLRKVILSLEQMNLSQKQQYVPYRDSKLTSILKKAFGGNCLTYLIACINPHKDYIQQTISTLQYAVSARKITNQVNVNIDIKARQIQQLKEDKAKLQRQLEMAIMQIEAFKSVQQEQEIRRASQHQYANRIIQCITTVRQLLKSNKQLRTELEKEKRQKKNISIQLQEIQKKIKSQTKKQQIQKRQTQKFQSPILRPKKILQTQGSPEMMSDRPMYSGSIDILKKKERGNSVFRRKKITFYEKGQRRSLQKLE